MKHCFFIMLTAAGLVACASGRAGEFNQQLKIGDPAPAWKDLPGTDGKNHSLADLGEQDLIVVVFTCNSCPVAVDYEDRLIAFARKHCNAGGKTTLVAINVNKIPDDSLEKMKVRAKEKGFTFPYLFDASQKIARDFGAEYTPEVFVLNKQRKIAYMGAFDDNSKASEVKVSYLEAAVQATLQGQKCSPAETQARGCRIRFERERR